MAPPIRAASIPPIAQARRAAVQRIFDGRSLVLAVDTNVLAYAAMQARKFHTVGRDWLEPQRARPDAWYTTWAILYEFLTTHAWVMRRPWSSPAAWNFVAALLASPRHNDTPTSPKR
jgi:predicted nucleic acid-binding protein